MAFTAFGGERAPIRFETTGRKLEQDILDAHSKGNSPVYPHQFEAVFAVKAKLAENPREERNDPVLVVAPTGSGKSGMIALLPYILQCRKALILTPSCIISKQLGECFGIDDHSATFFEKIGICPRDKREDFLEHGSILVRGSDIFISVANLVIVTAQKFAGRHLEKLTRKNSANPDSEVVVEDVETFFKKFDTLIVDEAHHYPAATWLNIEKMFRGAGGSTKQLIFLTATPKRKFKGKLIDILEKQRIAYTIERKVLEGKYIRPLRFKEEENEDQLHSHIKAILEDQEFLDQRFCKPRQSRMPQAMILVNSRIEADKLAEDLNESEGNRNFAVSIHGLKNNTAKRKTKEFKNGEKYQVAITCGLLLEGFDNEAVTLCVILRRTDSKVLFSQFIGRCMRLMKFEDEPKDRTIGTILSYPKYNQKEMFEDRDSLATQDPVETSIEDESPNIDEQPGASCSVAQSSVKRSQRTSRKANKRGRR